MSHPGRRNLGPMLRINPHFNTMRPECAGMNAPDALQPSCARHAFIQHATGRS